MIGSQNYDAQQLPARQDRSVPRSIFRNFMALSAILLRMGRSGPARFQSRDESNDRVHLDTEMHRRGVGKSEGLKLVHLAARFVAEHSADRRRAAVLRRMVLAKH
jgi:hypothetical protein